LYAFGVGVDRVYQFDPVKFPAVNAADGHNPPSERYIEIITLGCAHYGVAKEWIEYLKSVKCTPRKALSELKSVPDPDGLFEKKKWTCAELAKCDGNDGRDLCTCINLKVMKFVGDIVNNAQHRSIYGMAKQRFSGSDNTLRMTRVLYAAGRPSIHMRTLSLDGLRRQMNV
jgi:hypothetical protein